MIDFAECYGKIKSVLTQNEHPDFYSRYKPADLWFNAGKLFQEYVAGFQVKVDDFRSQTRISPPFLLVFILAPFQLSILN